MKITSFRIENYRGLRLAAMDELSSRPLTLLTGKNGTGKSLVLEALTAVWSGNINLPEFVGPYGRSLSIEVRIALDNHEYSLVNTWRSERGLEVLPLIDEHVLEAVSTNRESTGTYRQRDALIETLQNPLFSRSHPFASIDLLSARRQVSLTTSTAVDLSLLDKSSVADQRKLMYEQEIRWKSAMQMPDVGSYLTSLDYRDYVAKRDGIEIGDDYADLQEIFRSASGKTISLPKYNPATTKSSIRVHLPSGVDHDLEDLSNGEREMLGMLYYVSQLSTLGGVLLLDEPEKHLHPTLQLAVLKSMMSIADRGQIIVVTHAPALISSASSESVVVVRSAWEAVGNQLQRVSDADDHADLLADLGLAKRDFFQANFLLIVEGPDDEKRLRMLLPNEIGGAKVVVAGGREAVLKTSDALRGLDVGIPWMCVIDRDYLTDAECAELASDGRVFVWDARMLENILLGVDLVRGVLLPAVENDANFDKSFRAVLDGLKDAAVEQFVEARVRRVGPLPQGAERRGKKLGDRIEYRLHEEASLWDHRIRIYPDVRKDVVTEIDSRWDADWRYYVDGKRVISELQRRYAVFRNGSMLTDSLMVRARETTGLMPSEAQRLQAALLAMQAPAATVVLDSGLDEAWDQSVWDAQVGGGPVPWELNAPMDGTQYGC